MLLLRGEGSCEVRISVNRELKYQTILTNKLTGVAMGQRYRPIQPKDRLKIYELLFDGKSILEIAQAIRFHRSTLYRELERNSGKFGYRPDMASQHYLARRQRPGKLDSNLELRDFIISKLKEGW
ncbi:MAG: Integrase catalytic region, partial [Gammaproteobacteria bacterium]|nr:Integrase catalytic region [Gammaproteobacteria bacterium]